MTHSKRYTEAKTKIDVNKVYGLADAIALVQQTATVKFDSSVELHVRLNIDPKRTDQVVRFSVSLPHGSGKTMRIAAFVPDDQVAKVKAAGAAIAGGDELIQNIQSSGRCDFDIAVATPDMMKKLAAIARILGQKGLMPNPKTGTIGADAPKIVQELTRGKISVKNDQTGNIHVVCGKVSFPAAHLQVNISAVFDALRQVKPESVKGVFIKSSHLTSSMGPAVRVAV